MQQRPDLLRMTGLVQRLQRLEEMVCCLTFHFHCRKFQSFLCNVYFSRNAHIDHRVEIVQKSTLNKSFMNSYTPLDDTIPSFFVALMF